MTNETTLAALLVTAVLTGVIHTAAGPDHYLPFIAIAKSRRYSWMKTALWTLICGIGHVGSALLLAVVFLAFAHLLAESHMEYLEAWRGDIAAYALIGIGAAVLLHALHVRWRRSPHRHRHVLSDGSTCVHTHTAEKHPHGTEEHKLSYWVIFIIFVLGPCEALFPLLTASAVLGQGCVILVAAFFSAATIMTMLALVAAGFYGLNTLRLPWLEKFAVEIAGATVMCCGLAIVCLGW